MSVPVYKKTLLVVYPQGHASEGQPYSGASVYLSSPSGGANSMMELGSTGIYYSEAIHAGRYTLYINGSNAGISVEVGSGDDAAAGHDAGKMPVSTSTGRELKSLEDDLGVILSTPSAPQTIHLPLTILYGYGEAVIRGEEISNKETLGTTSVENTSACSADGSVFGARQTEIVSGSYAGTHRVETSLSSKCTTEIVTLASGLSSEDIDPRKRTIIADENGEQHVSEYNDKNGKKYFPLDVSFKGDSIDNGFTVNDLVFPLIIGHRGSLYICPENTIEGFIAAAQSGVTLIELDVHLTSGGALVVMHDNTLSRCCGSSINTEDLHQSVVPRYRVVPQLIDSNGYANWPTSLDLPTLDAVFDALRQYNVCFMIDVKSTVGDAAGFSACSTAVCACILRNKMRSRCIVAGFSLEVGLVAIANNIMAGYASDTGAYDPATLFAAGYKWYDISFSASTANISAAAAVDGLRVAIYSGNNHYYRDYYFGLGADAYFGNDPVYQLSSWVPAKKDGYRFGAWSPGTASYYGSRGTLSGGGLTLAPGIDTSSRYASVNVGSVSPVPVANYKCLASVLVSEAYNITQGVHFLFLSDDRPYNFISPASLNGYLFSLLCDGSLALYRMASGALTSIGTASSSALVLGTTIAEISLEFTSTSVIAKRLDGDDVTITAADTTYRPRYFAIGAKSVAATFLNISMEY